MTDKYAPWPNACKVREAQAMKEARDQLDAMPRGLLDPGNPNHPIHDGIFGYDRKEFLARQYAVSK